MKLQGKSFKTKFTDQGKWRCPICESKAKQIKHHLKTKHQDHIEDLEEVENYCKEIAVVKRRETKRKFDAKYSSNPERKEAQKNLMKKKDAKRAGKPERIEAKKLSDAKLADKPERKEAPVSYTHLTLPTKRIV